MLCCKTRCRVSLPSKIHLRVSHFNAVGSTLKVKSRFPWWVNNKEMCIYWFLRRCHSLMFSKGTCFGLTLNSICFSGRVLGWTLSLKNNKRIENCRAGFILEECIGSVNLLVWYPLSDDSAEEMRSHPWLCIPWLLTQEMWVWWSTLVTNN